jgi:uncharacterized protein DUF5808
VARRRRGRFLGIPYDWTRPTRASLLRDLWDPDDPRVFRPRSFGWGYSINVAALLGRARRRRR